MSVKDFRSIRRSDSHERNSNFEFTNDKHNFCHILCVKIMDLFRPTTSGSLFPTSSPTSDAASIVSERVSPPKRIKSSVVTPSPSSVSNIVHSNLIASSERVPVNPDRLNRAAKAILDRRAEIELWTTNQVDDDRIELHILDDEMYIDAASKYECVELLRLIYSELG